MLTFQFAIVGEKIVFICLCIKRKRVNSKRGRKMESQKILPKITELSIQSTFLLPFISGLSL